MVCFSTFSYLFKPQLKGSSYFATQQIVSIKNVCLELLCGAVCLHGDRLQINLCSLILQSHPYYLLGYIW